MLSSEKNLHKEIRCEAWHSEFVRGAVGKGKITLLDEEGEKAEREKEEEYKPFEGEVEKSQVMGLEKRDVKREDKNFIVEDKRALRDRRRARWKSSIFKSIAAGTSEGSCVLLSREESWRVTQALVWSNLCQ